MTPENKEYPAPCRKERTLTMKTKRIISLFLAAVLLLSAAACGSKEPPAPTLKEGVTLQSMVDSITETYGFTMPSPLDDTILKDLLGIDPGDVEEYAGYVTMVNLSANNLIAVKAKPDKLETVQKALQARKDFEVESFRQYLPDQYAMSEAGKVFTVGDYCFLVIMGRMDEDPASEISAIEQIIRDSFNS